MVIASSIFWILGFIFSVVMGPSLIIWTWGPSMLCFAFATAFALPSLWHDGLGQLNRFLLISGLTTVAWFASRAWLSPVQELAWMDLCLVMMAASSFIVFYQAFRSPTSQVIIVSGIACLLIINIGLMMAETRNPNFHLFIAYPQRAWPSGFFRHYSQTAFFLTASSLILAGFGLRSSWPVIARILLLLIALLGLGAVFYTHSRSGMLGAGAGVLALLIYWTVIAKRDNHKWSGLVLLIAPFLFIAIVAGALVMLGNIQQSRSADSNLVDMLDNDIRLYFYGIALSCIGLHPFLGGGSRSFSWEVYQFWDVQTMGILTSNPGHVHNEFIQAITDYGIIGALLLLIFIITIWIACTFRSFVKGNWGDYPNADAWRLGGFAAFVGIFIQSNFEGVLRTPPGAILLGVCLAAASHARCQSKSKSVRPNIIRNTSLVAFSLVAIYVLSLNGWKGTRVSNDLWKVVMAKAPANEETRIEAYSKALQKWELNSSYLRRGNLYFKLALKNPRGAEYINLLELALADYQSAIALHPYTPLYFRNAANTFVHLEKFEKAIIYYEKAIQLQGGLEATYKSRYQYAQLLLRLGHQETFAENFSKANAYFEEASKQASQTPGYIHGPPFYLMEADISKSLARSYEQQGKFLQALDQYDKTTQLRNGIDAHLFAAMMFMNRAEKAWLEGYPAVSLRLYHEAETRMNQFNPQETIYPAEMRTDLLDEIRGKIQQLQRDKYEPSEEILFEW